MLILLLLLLGHAQASNCPLNCKCSDFVVECSGLTRFPEAVGDVKTLILRSNRLQTLKKAHLSNWQGLEVLIITNNRIKYVEENVLDVAPKLRRFSLASNRLKTVPSLASMEHRLVSLNLKHNLVEYVDPQAFESLPSLIQLDLSHNRLQSLQISKHDQLKYFDIHHNPWNCDCRIEQIVKTLTGTDSEKKSFCQNPQELRHLPLNELTNDLISCQSAQVDSNSSSSTEIRLTCARESNKPIVWLYKNVEISSSELDSFYVESNRLHVPAKTRIDLISCTNDYEYVPHHRKRRQHPTAPQFTFKPRDKEYPEGSDVKINCEVVGTPMPQINWFFKGKKIKSSSRRQLSLSGHILRIKPFLQEDTGRYTCEAVNQHGRIAHTFQMELVSSVPPDIYEAPESQQVSLGDTVSFTCRATGTPDPDYTWSFDGSTIGHIRGRIHVSDDGSTLTINGVEKKDDGYYSCMAGNAVGAMSSDARLTVVGEQRAQIDDALLEQIVHKARENVERAVEKTRLQLTQERVTNTKDLKRLFRFSTPRQAVELSKAREVYEESVRLIREHVDRGLVLNVDDVTPPLNNSYEAVLHVTHVQTLMGMSGCHSGQFKDPCTDVCFHNKYRSFDGQCNNWKNPLWGVALMPLKRLLKPAYENGFNTPVGWDRNRLYHGYPMPNVREVSRKLVATEHVTAHFKLSAMLMQWGQFLDHDLTHTVPALSRHSYATGAFCNRTCENIDPCFNIQLSQNDPRIKGKNVTYPCIEFERSAAVCGSGETSLIFDRVTYREQMNSLTSFIDASNVYGSSEVQAQELRDTFTNKGTLRFDIKSNAGKPYMPFEKDSNMDCRRNFSESHPIRCFLAGDVRANEQLGLISMHTIFLREHNRIAEQLLAMSPQQNGEIIYYETRKIIGAMMQHITYAHWLPHVFGGAQQLHQFIGSYNGYVESTDASISNAFATAAFRFGHTLINPVLYRLNEHFEPIEQGHIQLHKAFFTPERVLSEGGIDPLLRGLFASPLKNPQPGQLLNMELIDKLFDKYHEVALDLAVMNIQRSRDHGLPSYTEYRRFCKLSVPSSWSEMTQIIKNMTIVEKLRGLYGVPENIDLWVGGIIEEKLPNALIGPTFACIIGDQFKRLRDGDRHWYEKPGVFTRQQLAEIKKITLGRLLCDNGDNINRVQNDVFEFHAKSSNKYVKCDKQPRMHLEAWRDLGDVCPTMLDRILRSRHRGSRLHGCLVENVWKPEGAKWLPRDQYCTECECRGSRVWCAVKDDCSDNRSPF